MGPFNGTVVGFQLNVPSHDPASQALSTFALRMESLAVAATIAKKALRASVEYYYGNLRAVITAYNNLLSWETVQSVASFIGKLIGNGIYGFFEAVVMVLEAFWVHVVIGVPIHGWFGFNELDVP